MVTRPASRPSCHAGETKPAPLLGRHVPNNGWRRGGAAHTARSDPDGLSLDQQARSAAFFLMTQQAAFDTSWMHLGPEPLLDQAHEFWCPHRRLFLACLDEESQDFVVQLVRLLGAAFVGNQAGETTLLEGFQRLIERGPGEVFF